MMPTHEVAGRWSLDHLILPSRPDVCQCGETSGTTVIALDAMPVFGLPAGFHPQRGSATKYLGVVSKAYWLPDSKTDLMSDTPLGVTWEGAAGAKDQERLLVSFAGGTVADSLHARPLAGREKFVEEQFEQALPGFSANHIKSEFVNWIGDPWTKCGYSFPLPGEFLSQSKILKDGLGNLHIAGEHASLGFFGFMEGGLHSGVQAANRLMQQDGIPVRS